ncbi:MAG: energy-coupling factor transporter ATPase [Clostridia bacterium]|jgi:energy-coupling factor transport system ATP-binding protein|nr:energy-coupling factor transporter ATPase [Clostridia bacterium]MDD4145737.1 energy-coupling factor transporter ATPase [Clostridia bacterium]MDD4665279.1 energy-coupling factor transporter ATPase [Clostridia bacterium]
MIDVKNLKHQFRNPQGGYQEALKGVDLQIGQGEFVAIIGHNGSGKSTLAKHFNALLLPHHGSVTVNGIDTRESECLWQIRQKVGMVFQNPDNQLIATTVEEDVAFGPENLGIEPVKIRQLVDEALESVGMSTYKKRAPHLLSGGQKQRVAIAGVVAMRPQVLVLDEPTAMLDPLGRQEVMDTVVKLNREEGLTVVLITHFMEEAVLADRVVVMAEGLKVMEDSPRGIFSRVQQLKDLRLDVPPMMELRDTLAREGLDLPRDILTVEEMVVALCR